MRLIAPPPDAMNFGQGAAFEPGLVTDLLDLKKEDVSRLSSVAVSSVRYDDGILAPMRDRLKEVANTINLVATLFAGDTNKTAAWFKARNPMLGDISPRDMIRLGRHDRLRKFINGMCCPKTAAEQTA